MSKTTRTTRTTAEKKKKKEQRVWTAREKAEAVLAVWSERRKPSEICKELEVQWASLNHWQTKAMEAILPPVQRRRRIRPATDQGTHYGPGPRADAKRSRLPTGSTTQPGSPPHPRHAVSMAGLPLCPGYPPPLPKQKKKGDL